jgi:thioredoxin reductase (NADPH)
MYLVIGRQNCPYCDKAKDLLDSKGLEYVYVDMTSGDCIVDSVWKHFLVDDLKVKTVPQIFNLTGGYDELSKELNLD